jgi:hypothetical protein
MSLLTRISNIFQYETETRQDGKGQSKGRFQIVEMSKQHITPSVDAYLQAVQSARSKLTQSRIALYDNYEQTMLFDPFIKSLIDKRLDNISNKQIQFFKDDVLQEQYADFFKAPRFKSFLRDLLLTRFWGMGLFEFHGREWFDYVTIPVKHLNPYKKEVLRYQHDSTGTDWTQFPNVLFVGGANDYGLLEQITLLSIYKRLGTYCYGKYVDLASENFSTMRLAGMGDEKTFQDLQSQIANRGGGGVAALPPGIELQQQNQSSSSQNQLFEGYMKMLKEELSILILGQTMTTSDGSSRSQAEVHQSEQSSKFAADDLDIENILNYDFADYLKLWGLPTENVRFELVPTDDQTLAKRVENYKILKELGVMFTDEELRDKFKTIIE